jgi:hypothetical protein
MMGLVYNEGGTKRDETEGRVAGFFRIHMTPIC